jgi:methyl-accepting chemotaxis protein
MKFRWSIAARCVAIAWVAVAVTAIASLIIQRSLIRQQGLDMARETLRSILLCAESTLMSGMNSGADAAGPALKAVQVAADKQGYEFRVPSRNPLNPKSAPAPEEEQILAKLTDHTLSDYFEVDRRKNEIIYARPIYLTAQCLGCHSGSAGDLHSAFLLRAKLDQLDARERAGMTTATLWVAPLALAIGLGAFLMTRSIRASLVETVRVLAKIAGGDLTEELSVCRNDEIGDIAAAMRSMSEKLREIIGGIARGVALLTESAAQLSASSQRMTSSSRSAFDKVHSVATAAEEMSCNAMSASVGMEHTTTNLGNVASSTDQMTATIGEIAGNSEQARRVTEEAAQQSARITDHMHQLGRAAREIGKVTQTITEISSQTNLLALNATIEAARAGAAGKGFAVVANEVKELAQQAAAATEDIKTRVRAVQSSTDEGVAEVESVASVVAKVSELVSSIAAAIEEQATVTKDIAHNIGDASTGVGEANSGVAHFSSVSLEIAKNIAGVDGALREMAGDSEHVQSSAEKLSKLALELNAAVAQFHI